MPNWVGKVVAVVTNHGDVIQGRLVSDSWGLHLTGARMRGGLVTEVWIAEGTWDFVYVVPEEAVEVPPTSLDDWAGETTGNIKIAAVA